MPLKSSHTEQEDYHRHREAEPLSFTKLNPEASRSLTPKLHSQPSQKSKDRVCRIVSRLTPTVLIPARS
jgi:hypothetical protein